MERQKVYIVSRGEKYEGDTLYRIFNKVEDAEKYVEAELIPNCLKLHGWKRRRNQGPYRWTDPQGICYVEIEEWEVY